MIDSIAKLDGGQIDILGEVGNIGTGNAATSLAAMIDESVHIDVPQVMVLDYSEAVNLIGKPDEPGVAIMIRYGGDVNGIILFLLRSEDVSAISGMLMSDIEAGDGPEGFSELTLSMVKELGNILGSSYLNSISTLTGLRFDISIPFVSIDMIGAVLNTPIVEFSIDGSKILLIEGSFYNNARSVKSHVLLFADLPSLDKIMARLGIEK